MKTSVSELASWRVSELTARNVLPVFCSIMLCFAHAVSAQTIQFTSSKAVPDPSKMKADIRICGNTSQLHNLSVVKITGREIPKTYSGNFIHSYPGFSWFVSRHYAVFSDLPDPTVRDALVILELSWPHYARTFQWRPPQSDSCRQAIVYASTRNILENCMLDDNLHANLQGGLTQEGYACAYLYAGFPYQTRYILIHEATHVYQYCLSGDTRSCYGFLLEGIADYLSSHIYDPTSQKLTVNVLDRAPIHNHLACGLAEWHQKGEPDFSDIYNDPYPSRGFSVLLTAFLQRTPELEKKWELFCERIVRDMPLKAAKATTDTAISKFYGTPTSLNADFKKWIKTLTPTFELVNQSFDQNGKWSFRSYPATSNTCAKLKINLRPKEEIAVEISRPLLSGKLAGFTYGHTSFSMSNTWSHGCMFIADANGKTKTEEIPVALIKNMKSPFKMTITPIVDAVVFTATDATGSSIIRPIRFDGISEEKAPCPMSLFSTESSVLFNICGTGEKHQETNFSSTGKMCPEVISPDFSQNGLAGPITKWNILGTFDPSETTGNDIISHTEDIICANDGTRLRWAQPVIHDMTAITPPLVNLNEHFRRQANGRVAFARTELMSDEEQTCTLVLGVADGVEVFINGKKHYGFNGKRAWSDGNIRIADITLRKGYNKIDLKLTHHDSAWLFSGRIWLSKQ